MDEEKIAAPCSYQPGPSVTPKFNATHFDENLCYAPDKGNTKRKLELCKTLLPVMDSQMSPPRSEEGPLKIPPSTTKWTRI